MIMQEVMYEAFQNRRGWGKNFTEVEEDPAGLIVELVDYVKSSPFHGIVFKNHDAGLPGRADGKNRSDFEKEVIQIYLFLLLSPVSVREDFLLAATVKLAPMAKQELESAGNPLLAEILYRARMGFSRLDELKEDSIEYTRHLNKEMFLSLAAYDSRLGVTREGEVTIDEEGDSEKDNDEWFEDLLLDNYPDYFSVMRQMGWRQSEIPLNPQDLPEKFKVSFDRVSLQIDLKEKARLFRSDKASDKKRIQMLMDGRYSDKKKGFGGIFSGLVERKSEDVTATEKLPTWLTSEISQVLDHQKKLAVKRKVPEKGRKRT